MTWTCTRHAVLTGLFLFITHAGLAAKPAAPPGYLETFKNASTTSTPGSQGEQQFRVYNLEFTDAASAAKFSHPLFTIFNRSGRFVDLFAPPTEEALNVVANAENLIWLDYNRTIELPPVPRAEPVAATRSTAEKVARLGAGGYTGKGVTLAVIDSGIDIRHPDFTVVGPDGIPQSRFRALWDTTEMRAGFGKPAPIKYPGGQPIGVIYSRDDLNRYLATPVDQRPEILWDGNGHGTSCAGIAAGNGRALPDTRYAGVASQADLIGIRIGDQAQNTYLITALLRWLDEEAGSRPLVVSNSWGGHRSGHDGSSLIERQIDDRFGANRPGRLVLFAAGNEGDEELHAAVEYGGPDQPGVLQLAPMGPEDSVEMTVYFDSADPSLNTTSAIPVVNFVHGLTGQTVWRLAPVAGQETLEIFSADGKPGKLNAYVVGQIGESPASFLDASYTSLVNNPGTAENVLTVGSYDFNPFFEQQGNVLTLGVGEEMSPMTVGDISDYSSPGLTRLGRLKPDFTAPGQWWTAPAPLTENENLAYDTSGLYNLFNGTSAATPYAAGVMALLLEKNPRLTLNEVRALLDRHLKPDAYTGALPNPAWGRGKLSLRAIEAMLAE